MLQYLNDLAVTLRIAGAGMMPFQVAIHIMVFMTTSFSTNTSLFVILEQPIHNNMEIKVSLSEQCVVEF